MRSPSLQNLSCDSRPKKTRNIVSLSDLPLLKNPYKSFKQIDPPNVSTEKKFEYKQIERIYNSSMRKLPPEYFQKLCHLLKSKDELYYKKRKILEKFKQSKPQLEEQKKTENNLLITLQDFRELAENVQNLESRRIEFKNRLSMKIIDEQQSKENIEQDEKYDLRHIPEFLNNDVTINSDISVVKVEEVTKHDDTFSDGERTVETKVTEKLVKMLITGKEFESRNKVDLKNNKSVSFRKASDIKSRNEYLSLLPVKSHMDKLDLKMRKIYKESKAAKNSEIYLMYYSMFKPKKEKAQELDQLTKRIKFLEDRRNDYLGKMLDGKTMGLRSGKRENTLRYLTSRRENEPKKILVKPSLSQVTLPKMLSFN